MRIRYKVGLTALPLCALLFCVGCQDAGSSQFERISEEFTGCVLRPPWPVEVTSVDEDSASFYKKSDVESTTFYFEQREVPTWRDLKHVVEGSVERQDISGFEVVRLRQFYKNIDMEISIQYTIFRRNEVDLVLAGSISEDWESFDIHCDT